LYAEEIRLKKEHLNVLEWLLVVPFVISKYVFKKLTK